MKKTIVNITILNYNHYQNMANYEFVCEGHNEGTNEGTIKRKKGLKKDKYSCPYNQILDLYHEILAELPRVRKITEGRKIVYLMVSPACAASPSVDNRMPVRQAAGKRGFMDAYPQA